MAFKNQPAKSRKESSAAPQWNEFLICSFCKKDFDHKDHSPISLSCGHTVCRKCLKNLRQPQCHLDHTPITCNISDLPVNSALLQLLPDEHEQNNACSLHTAQSASNAITPTNIAQYVKKYENAKSYIDKLALHLDPCESVVLSCPIQRKLVTLAHCQLCEDEGRKRALRTCRALGERIATELIFTQQNPTTLSANLWAAVRARGCQFLGPAMQEEALKLIHLALEDGSELSRKVLVQIVVKQLRIQFAHASKTSIGHVVQLLYRASCFRVTKREDDSSLMRLKDNFLIYEELRKEHDTQIVQIAREVGLRIAPDQWSLLLYGDQVHKSYMQSLIDTLQSGASFEQCIIDLNSSIQASGDAAGTKFLLPHFKVLSEINPENLQSSWVSLENCLYSVKICIDKLTDFNKSEDHMMCRTGGQDASSHTSKISKLFKTSMCRDCRNKSICPRGQNCMFAHSKGELQFYRNRRKKCGQMLTTIEDFEDKTLIPADSFHNKLESGNFVAPNDHCNQSIALQDVSSCHGSCHVSCTHMCHCGYNMQRNMNQTYGMSNSRCFPTPCTLANNTVINPALINGAVSQYYPPIHSCDVNSHSLPVRMPSAVIPLQNVPQHHHQAPFIRGNDVPVIYNTKQKSPYGQVETMPANQLAPYLQNVEGGQIEMVSPKHSPIPQGEYMLSGHQVSAKLPHMPAAQLVQKVITDSVATNPIYPSGQAFNVAWQNGQQVLLPASSFKPTNIHHQGQFIMQQPYFPVHTLQPPCAATYPASMVPVMPITSTSDIASQIEVSQSEQSVLNCDFAKVTSSVPVYSAADASLKPVETSMKHLNLYTMKPSGSTSNDSSPKMLELAKLNHRKDEVINKLVQKRITAPKLEHEQHQKHQLVPNHGVLEHKKVDSLLPSTNGTTVIPGSVNSYVATQKNFYSPVTKPNHSVQSSMNCVTDTQSNSVNDVTEALRLTSDGQYCLWIGTTCIPSISGLSFQNLPSDKDERSSPSIIDVISELDTRTAHVTAGRSDTFLVNQSSITQPKENITHLFTSSADDDIVSIQDQRIVSKYGPIARNVRSKTTSAIPEQVTANANGNTHSFRSDVSRNQTNFVANDGDIRKHRMMYISAEVEPSTIENSNAHHPQHCNISSGFSNNPNLEIISNQTFANRAHPEDENEDLLLAIELQEIELGIRRLQRNTLSTK